MQRHVYFDVEFTYVRVSLSRTSGSGAHSWQLRRGMMSWPKRP